ncbi:MAG: carboxymethylenebutenolidase [Nocardioidaceae bacterium]|nr:carboxymethylenebutenolidase [Nocardioidaceae bacterium]
MPARLWSPPGGADGGPAILMLQEIFGVSGYIRRRAAALAEAGYLVLAPELYWRLGDAVEPLDEKAPDALDQGVARVTALDWDQAVDDAVTALLQLRGRADVDGVGIVGFCFGGGLGFNVAAVAEPDCLVSYYGSALPDLLHLAPDVTAPSLHHFGLDDVFVDADSVVRIREAVTAAGTPVEFETYEGANHAFDNDDFMFAHEEASALAWERTLRFLAEHLGPAS